MAAFPGSSLLHKRLSEYAASPADSMSSPWSFAPAGPVVAAGDLSSPFFPGPSEDLARGSPRGRGAAGLLGCLGSPLAMRDSSGPCCWPQSHAPGEPMSLDQHSSVACRGFGWRRAGYQALVQPGAGEMYVVHADKKQVLWSGGTIVQGLLRHEGAARVLELPGSTEQWDGHGTFGEQCLAQPAASL